MRAFRSPSSGEREFRAAYVEAGRAHKFELWLVLLVMLTGLLLIQVVILDVPSDVLPVWTFFGIAVLVPAALRWLSGSPRSPIHRWSTELFILSVFIDAGALMVTRVICIRHGYDVVPIIVPVAVIAALLVVQIPFRILAPSVIAAFAAVVAVELTLIPVTTNRLFGLAASGAILLVPLASSFQFERSTRNAWRRQQQLNVLATTDSLTGLRNRHALHDEFRRVAADAESMSLAILDIDHFKALNDRLGHLAGDDALAAIGARLVEEATEDEIIARVGGEEFMVCWADVDVEYATARTEHLRQVIRDLDLPSGDVAVPVTLSAGVATSMVVDAHYDTLRRRLAADADRALYRAKAAGRDRSVVHSGAPATVGPVDPLDTPRRSATADATEAGFLTDFTTVGRRPRQLIMGAFLLVCVLILVFQSIALQIPAEAGRIGALFLVFGIMPPGVVFLATSVIRRLDRWSAEIYVGCVAVIVLAQDIQRVIQLPRGLDVVPMLMPAAVILSLGVVHIRQSLLVPSMALLVGGLATVEITLLPISGYGIIELLSLVVMAVVVARFAQRVQDASRLDWLTAKELDRRSHVDMLTGLPNRRRFDADLDRLIARPVTAPAAVVVLDTDRLKQFNDAFGHPAGDAFLRQVGHAFGDAARRCDAAVYRLGGEEFAAILTGSTNADLDHCARAMVDAVAALGVDAPITGTVMTASAGLALLGPGDDATTVYRRADGALYRAKAAGRNRLVTDRQTRRPVGVASGK